MITEPPGAAMYIKQRSIMQQLVVTKLNLVPMSIGITNHTTIATARFQVMLLFQQKRRAASHTDRVTVRDIDLSKNNSHT